MEAIEQLTKLTTEQMLIVNQIEELYLKAQKSGIAFAINENRKVVAYNAIHIADCESGDLFNHPHEEYEYLNIDSMYELFPVWDAEETYVLRKGKRE